MGFNIALHSEPLDQEWFTLVQQVNDFVTSTYNGEIKNHPLTWNK
jgi:hypothetical protein